MSLNYVKYVRSNEVNDIFSYINCEGKTEYLTFPKSMEMNVNDLDEWLNK